MIIRELKPPSTSLDLILEVVTLSGLFKILVLISEQYAGLPDRIAIHYAFSGEANGFGSKALIWIFPALVGVLHLTLTFLIRRPDKLNYPVVLTPDNYERQYINLIRLIRFVKLNVVGILLWLTYETLINVQRDQPHISPIVVIGVFLLLIGTIGAFVYRSYRLR